MFFIVLIGGTLLLALSNHSTPRSKRFYKTALLTPLLVGLLLTTFVYAATADARGNEPTEEQQHLWSMLQITGVCLIVIGTCSLVIKIRETGFWLPKDTPFENYKPFKPAYISTFPAAPITAPTFEPQTMTLADAARYLRVSEHDVWQLADEGSIVAIRRGSTYVVTRRALDDFAQREQFGL